MYFWHISVSIFVVVAFICNYFSSPCVMHSLLLLQPNISLGTWKLQLISIHFLYHVYSKVLCLCVCMVGCESWFMFSGMSHSVLRWPHDHFSTLTPKHNVYLSTLKDTLKVSCWQHRIFQILNVCLCWSVSALLSPLSEPLPIFMIWCNVFFFWYCNLMFCRNRHKW